MPIFGRNKSWCERAFDLMMRKHSDLRSKRHKEWTQEELSKAVQEQHALLQRLPAASTQEQKNEIVKQLKQLDDRIDHLNEN